MRVAGDRFLPLQRRVRLPLSLMQVTALQAQFLQFLENLELRRETRVEIKKREYDETMTLRAAGRTMHLGKPATSRIWVRRVGP